MPRVMNWTDDDDTEVMESVEYAGDMSRYKPVSNRQASQRRAEDGQNREIKRLRRHQG